MVTAGLLLLLLLIGTGVSFAQTPALRVRFLGPDDSTKWEIRTMAVGRENSGATLLGVGSGKYAAVRKAAKWNYFRPYYLGAPWWWATADNVIGIAFSPWEDYTFFLAYEIRDTAIFAEPLSAATRYVNGAQRENWEEQGMFGDLDPSFFFFEGAPRLALKKMRGLYTSTDSGRRWEPQCIGNFPLSPLAPASGNAIELLQYNSNTSGFEVSADTGHTWVQRSTIVDPEMLQIRPDRLLHSKRAVYLSCMGRNDAQEYVTTFWRSDDGARTWTKLLSVFGTGVLAIDTSYSARLFVAHGDSLAWSYNEGASWSRAPHSIPTGSGIVVALEKDPSADVLYAGTSAHGVYSIDGFPTDVVETRQPEAVKIGSPYPNPSREDVFIPLTLEKGSAVRVTIHDALGRRVATLQDGFLSAGSHTLRQSVTRLAKGMYAVRVSCAGTSRTRQFAIE